MDQPARCRRTDAANSVRARRLGIDTQYEAIIFMHRDCRVCRSEGFTAHTRVLLKANGRQSHRNTLSDDESAGRVTTRPSCPSRPGSGSP